MITTSLESGSLPIVRTGQIGHAGVGKTCTMHSVMMEVIRMRLTHNIQLGMRDPRDLLGMQQSIELTGQLLIAGRLPSTTEPSLLRFEVSSGFAPQVSFECHDHVGQIVSETASCGVGDDHAAYVQYTEELANCDVLWVFVDVSQDAETVRFKGRIELTATYLRQALASRPQDRPTCSVAIVLTHTDTRGGSVIEAKAMLHDDLLQTMLADMVHVCNVSPSVRYAAIFPISNLGFGRAERICQTTDLITTGLANRPQAAPDHRRHNAWVVKDGGEADPFNTDSLLLWTLASGLDHQQASPDNELLVDVAENLVREFSSHSGWHIPLKGDLRAESSLGDA